MPRHLTSLNDSETGKTFIGAWNLNLVLAWALVFAGQMLLPVGSCLAITSSDQESKLKQDPPNVILLMTDDQGWGDFGIHGNDVVRTPNFDALAAGSVEFDNFYVSPVCSPTRACLMTGRYNYRTRCIDTYLGRSMMDTQEVTIAELLKQNSYATGIFGKWHLGDCYPMRPMDQGFDISVVHRGGGLAQPSDPLENENRYTDPILFRNGIQFQAQGYCTDVYFDEALKFIQQQHEGKRPFFAYIATNAPHGPLHDVPETLKQQYLDDPQALQSVMVGDPANLERRTNDLASVFAMITNVDQNLGRLIETLDNLGITDNTIILFLNDNGPASSRYVGKFRGTKATVFEGGVRSPLWIHWPAKITPGEHRTNLSAHIDVLPTIMDACQIEIPDSLKLDGRSLLPAALDSDHQWLQRNIVLQTHRGDTPQKFHNCMIRLGEWKLVHPSGFGKEQFEGKPKFQLYNVTADPGESDDLAHTHPEIVKQLRSVYESWFEDVSSTRPDNFAPPRIKVGYAEEPETVLTRNDWRGKTWNDQEPGVWLVEFAEAGNYEFQVIFRNPVQQSEDHPLAAVLKINQQQLNSPKLDADAPNRLAFSANVKAGPATISCCLLKESASGSSANSDPKLENAYQIFIRRK